VCASFLFVSFVNHIYWVSCVPLSWITFGCLLRLFLHASFMHRIYHVVCASFLYVSFVNHVHRMSCLSSHSRITCCLSCVHHSCVVSHAKCLVRLVCLIKGVASCVPHSWMTYWVYCMPHSCMIHSCNAYRVSCVPHWGRLACLACLIFLRVSFVSHKEGVLDIQKSPIIYQKSPIIYQKSPIAYQKSPIIYEKSPVFHPKRYS